MKKFQAYSSTLQREVTRKINTVRQSVSRGVSRHILRRSPPKMPSEDTESQSNTPLTQTAGELSTPLTGTSSRRFPRSETSHDIPVAERMLSPGRGNVNKSKGSVGIAWLSAHKTPSEKPHSLVYSAQNTVTSARASVTSPSVTSPSVTSPSVTSPSVTSARASVTSASVTSAKAGVTSVRASVTSPSVTSTSETSARVSVSSARESVTSAASDSSSWISLPV